ncbi:hypothetical protein DL96DRAFT_1256004 [Flagelloscypha sp. PMI_526]|nr:hypothetical protein DL96DRAFT_1256004 [Flagelloscypha sp. PMI_526]
MFHGFRDTIDSLLVPAGLFSAVAAAFIVQTSLISINWNSFSNSIKKHSYVPEGPEVECRPRLVIVFSAATQTTTTADAWINDRLLASLCLSMKMALLAVLVKQWCQYWRQSLIIGVKIHIFLVDMTIGIRNGVYFLCLLAKAYAPVNHSE